MATNPAFMRTVERLAPTWDGEASLASMSTLNKGTRPIFTLKAVTIKRKHALSQTVLSWEASALMEAKEKSMCPVCWAAKPRNNTPAKASAIPIEHTYRYFQVASSESWLRLW